MNAIVRVEGLRKTYGGTVAVDEVFFKVWEGEIFGMIAPNEAGMIILLTTMELGNYQ